MEDILFSRNLFFLEETPGFTPGDIIGVEFFNNLEFFTVYREIITIS